MTYLQNQTNNISSSPNRSWVSPVIMNKCTINEDSWLKCLLGLKYTPDLKWKLYICTIAKDDGKIISSLYYSLKYPIPTAMLYHYKSQTRPKKWSIATIFGIGLPNPHFPGLIKFKKHLCKLNDSWKKYFSDHYYLNLLKSKVNLNLSLQYALVTCSLGEKQPSKNTHTQMNIYLSSIH